MPVNMLDREGNRVVVDDADVAGAVAQGFHVETSDEQASRVGEVVQQEQYGGLGGTLTALGTGALRGVTFGGSDLLLGALGGDDLRHDLSATRKVNPIASTLGEVAGAIAPALVAPTSLLARTPAGLVGQAATRGFEAGRTLGGVRGAAQAAAATGVEGALQSGGAYLSDIALGDRELTAEGMAGALGSGFAFGGAAGGALYGIEKGSIAARRMFARPADSRAADLAEQEWKQQSQSVLEANDQAADLARQRLAELRAAREQAELAVQRADAGIADIRAGRESKPSPEEVKLSEAIAEHDAARLEFETLLQKLEAPAIEPGLIPQTPGVPVGEFGAPGARGYDPGAVRAPAPPEPVPAQTGDVTAIGKRKVAAEGTPVAPAAEDPSRLPLRLDVTQRARNADKYKLGRVSEPEVPLVDRRPLPIAKGKAVPALAQADDAAAEFLLDRVHRYGVSPFPESGNPDRFLGSLGIDWSVPRNKQTLLDLLRDGKVALNRADLVDTMDGALVDASHVGDDFGDFHLIATPNRPAIPAHPQVELPVPRGRGIPDRAAGDAPAAPGSLEQQLLEMQQRLGAGASIGELGAAKRAHPASLKQLEQQYDELVERADEAVDAASKQQLLRQASQVEEQIAAASPRSLVHEVADIAPVATRYEQAAAAVTEAVDDIAPQAAKDSAKALRDAEALADTKLMDRTTRAVDDAADPPKPVKAKKPGRPPELEQARARKLNAEADLANARVAESEARLGSQQADRVAKDARTSTERATDVIGLPKPPIREQGRRLGALGDVGAALEVADVIGIPGLPRPRDIPIIGGLLSAYLKFRAIKAAAGRFTGRVEATGNAKAAVLAAKTKDRIASAVDQSLGFTAKHASKARAPAVAVGVRVMNALRDRAIDDGDPDAKKDATLTQVAAVRMREVGVVAANPQLIIAKVRHEMRDVHDPDLIAAMEKHQVAKYQHLNDVAPKAPPPNPYTKRVWEPSPAVALSWGRRYEVANDPAVAFEALQQQSLTPQMAETLRAVYPKLFAMAQERLVSRAGDLDEPVNYKQCLRNSLLFDVPLHPSLEPESLAVLQGAHTPIPLTPEPQPGPPAPSIAGGGALTNLYTTGADRRASMR